MIAPRNEVMHFLRLELYTALTISQSSALRRQLVEPRYDMFVEPNITAGNFSQQFLSGGLKRRKLLCDIRARLHG